jgi:hypothetical protein
VRLALGTDEIDPTRTERVLEEVGTLLAALNGRAEVGVEVDRNPVQPRLPDFSEARPEWLQLLREQDRRLNELPELARRLEQLVADPSFRWYVTVRDKRYFGRADGLTVCTIDRHGSRGVLRIGAAGGRESRVGKCFREAANGRNSFDFDADRIEEAATIVRALVGERKSGCLRDVYKEHYLESQVLRGEDDVVTDTRRVLRPVRANGQFPTLWSLTGSARYVDVLMRDDDVPCVVELKDRGGGGAGRYLRHAIGQVVLYREVIRGAQQLHEWFREQQPPLHPETCRAAVAFPNLGAGASGWVKQLREVAALFDVSILELDCR